MGMHDTQGGAPEPPGPSNLYELTSISELVFP